MRKLTCCLGIFGLFFSCTNAQSSREEQTILLLSRITEICSSNTQKNISEYVSKLDSNFCLKTEIFQQRSSESKFGYDSIHHYFNPKKNSEDNITLTYLNQNFRIKNTISYVRWLVQCRYTLENGKPIFENGSIYHLELADIKNLFGDYQKEKIPREASSKCTFYYTNPSTNIKAEIVVDCFLPCDSKDGNTINYITIIFQK